jgi:dienelactone hydrolase
VTTAARGSETDTEERELRIPSVDGTLSARHFRSARDELASAAGRPCIVMAHGIGATQDSGLAPFAMGLAAAGAEVLTFDFRHFARSDGEPRQLVSIRRELEDYHAAVAYARQLRGVDPARVYVWGVSLAGGHVIRAATEDSRIAGLFALTPAVDGLPVVIGMVREHGVGYLLRLLSRGLADAFAGLLRRPPVLIPIVGEPGEVAALTSEGAVAGMLATAGPSWRNEFAARLLLSIGGYRPGRRASQVTCPALVQIADGDRSASPAAATKAAAAMKATVHHYPCDHFDVYPGAAWHERILRDQVAFLRRVAVAATVDGA